MAGMGWVVRHRRVCAVGVVGFAIVVLFFVRSARENALHASVAEELRRCGVDASTPREPLFPITFLRPLQRAIPSVGSGPLGGPRVTRVVFRAGSDAERAVDLLCRLDHVQNVTLYVDGRSEILTVEQLERLTATVDPEFLYLEGLAVPRTAIPALNGSRLRWLLVARTDFSNPAIKSLPPSLEHLDATRTRIDDEGLPLFASMTNLKTLILRRTPTSEEAIEELREQMPWCVIRWQSLDATGS